MKCKIVGENLRVFSKAIRVFSKLSNEVLFITNDDGMKLQAINDHKTGFVEIHFFNRFFSTIECLVETKCKLFIKSLILVFRVVNIDKIVETLTIIMEETLPRVVIRMKCKPGVNREYFLPYVESTCFRYSSNLNRITPTFKAQSKQMSECLQHFSNDTKDITVWLLSDRILFKSYFDDIEDQNIITSFAYKSLEFQNYNFVNEISVTFNVKDLKSFLEFTSYRDQTVSAFFEASGKPIEFEVNANDFYSAKMILSTHDFPEDYLPQPPAVANQTHQNLSLLSTGDISVDYQSRSTVNNNSQNSEHLMTTRSNHAVVSESMDALQIDAVNDVNTGNNIANCDEFDEEDDDLINQMLGEMPDFSNDDNEVSLQTDSQFPLTGSPLHRYHMSVFFGNEEDDNPVTTSQDIMVPESDDEQ